MALWRSSAEGRLPSHGKRPFTPPVLGAHAVLVALHPEGMEVVLATGTDGKDRLLLANSNTVLAPLSRSYHLRNHAGDPRLLVVVGMGEDAGTGERDPEQHGVALEGDTAAGTSGGGA